MLKPKKELGQNFLRDITTIKNMVNALNVKPNESVIEIGPGLGALTNQLILKTSEKNDLFLVEYDPRFIKKLKRDFDAPNVKVINENILDWLPQYTSERDTKIIGSIPYYITSPIIHSIVKMDVHPISIILLMQKEVAQKISQSQPNASYLSTFVQTFFSTEYLETVDKESFDPVPQVDGGVLKLTKHKMNISHNEVGKYARFLHRGFSNPRKMLNKVFTQDELKAINFDGKLRPQNITVEKWVTAFKVLYS